MSKPSDKEMVASILRFADTHAAEDFAHRLSPDCVTLINTVVGIRWLPPKDILAGLRKCGVTRGMIAEHIREMKAATHLVPPERRETLLDPEQASDLLDAALNPTRDDRF